MITDKEGRRVPKILYFKDRYKLAEDIELPASSENYIVIPPNKFGLGYIWPKYSRGVTEGEICLEPYIDYEDYVKMASDFNRMVEETWKEHNKPSFSKLHSIIGWLFRFSMACIVIAFIVFTYITLYNPKFKYRDDTIKGVMAVSIASILSSFVANLVLIIPDPKYITFTERLEKRTQAHLKHLNSKLIKTGLEILPGKRAIWLEIWPTCKRPYKRPMISLMGNPPIDQVNHSIEVTSQEIFKNNEDLLAQFKRMRFNPDLKLSYLSNSLFQPPVN